LSKHSRGELDEAGEGGWRVSKWRKTPKEVGFLIDGLQGNLIRQLGC